MAFAATLKDFAGKAHLWLGATSILWQPKETDGHYS